MVYVLAAASALASAVGGVLQRIGIEKAPPEHAMRLRLLVDALRRGVWLLGFAMLLAAFGLQASALRFGGLTVVQPVLTLDLLYIIVILKVVFRRTLGGAKIGGSLAIVAGLVAFLVSADPSIGQGLPASRPLVVVTVAVAVIAAMLVVAARRGPRWWRATAFGAAAGALFAYNASLTKATAKLVTGGWGHVFTHWEPYAIGVTGALGFFLLQNALHAGPIAASRATMIMVNPVVSIIIGTLVFNEHFRGGPGFVAADVASLAVMLAGGYLLAQSPLVAGATLDGAQGERLGRTVAPTRSAPRGGLMVCGTTSDAGKSTVVAGLCRLLARQGVSVAPFKGQNMSLNSMVTAEGAEIGRAQWFQAIAAGAMPEAAMNPVLLKPTSERSSQVVLMGRALGVQEAASYQASKASIIDVVDGALEDLRSRYDIVVCEGAGSPAEINLLDHDIVNLGLARRAGLPAIVVGDIHRGGVFAHLFGTVAILPDELRQCVRGFVINMFRGDRELLGDAMDQLEARCGVPTLGVLPYLPGLVLDAEDSLHQMLSALSPSPPAPGSDLVDVAVMRFPRLSNFTDLDPLLAEPGVQVRFVDHPLALGRPDLVILPGTKATVADLTWLGETGLIAALETLSRSASPPVTLGICGGFQMLGRSISDPDHVESERTMVDGLGWLEVDTLYDGLKITRLRGATEPSTGTLDGYEIHHGRTVPSAGWRAWLAPADGEVDGDVLSARRADGLVLGTALHGLFEADGFRTAFVGWVAKRAAKHWVPSGRSFAGARQEQIDCVADACARYLDTDALWRLMTAPAFCA